MNRAHRIVAAIVLAGFAARAAAIWLGRPEFVGWFNHSYYYWVQVEGLLRDGRLPFADLPLLFWVYGGLAGLLRFGGLEPSPAIVNAARSLMSLTPALIAVPTYGLVRGITRNGRLPIRQWTLVCLAAFLPLTFVHIPELLQKNCLGLLWLACLMGSTHRWLRARSARSAVICGAFFLLIALTHLGTLAVTLLFVLALALAVVLQRADARRLVGGLLLVAGCSAIALAVVRVLDAEAFQRVLLYARSSVPDSLLGSLFGPAPVSRKLTSAAGVVLPVVALLSLGSIYRRHRVDLPAADRLFWMTCLVFGYLLVFPLFDLDLLPRFVLFLPLPVLVILAYFVDRHAGRRVGTALVSVAALGIALLTFGETMSLIHHSPNGAAIHRDLVDLKERYNLTRRDLVLTRYGVNPICNWFLGTPSGLITAFDRDDFRSYDRVFVLNPTEGSMGPTRDAGVDETSASKQAYLTMRRNVLLPADSAPVAETEHLRFYRLSSLPASWRFDAEGRWIGTNVTPTSRATP